MESPHLREFAKRLIQTVRDVAIQNCDACLNPESHSPVAKRWRAHDQDGTTAAVIHRVIPDCVDEVVFCLLNQMDEGRIKLTYTAHDGSVVDLCKEGRGEMAGWYMGSDGWRHQYARERFADDVT